MKKIPVLLILVLTFLSFYPTLNNGFTNWDDNIYVTGNTVIQHLSWNNIKWIFSSIFNANYHPLTILTYGIEYTVFKANPFGYHLINLVLHLLNSLLVFWLIFLLSKNMPVALITALFFGIHPLHVESVTWVSGTKDVLCAFFFLGALISYAYYLRERRVSKYYYLSLALFILSCLSKAMAVTLPLVLFLIDYFLYRKREKAIFMDKIPFFVSSLIFGVIALFGQHFYGGERVETALNLLQKIATVDYAVIFYLGKLFLPIGLSCLYPYPGIKEHALLYFYPSIIASLLIIAIIIAGKYTRKIVFSAGFFIASLIPVLQFVPISRTIVADRYVYIPSIGIFYAVAAGFVWLYGRRTRFSRLLRFTLLALLIVAICILTSLTWKRCRVWKDSITLWSDLLRNQPGSFVAYSNRGQAYLSQGNFNEAFSDYSEAIKINPGLAEAYNNRGVIYQVRGNIDGALSDFKKAVEINPRFADAYNNLGLVYFEKQEYDLSWENMHKAETLGRKVNPEFIELLKKQLTNKKGKR